MRVRLRNRIGTASLRKPATKRGSASHLRLIPPEGGGALPYNGARTSQATDLAGRDRHEAAPGGGAVVFLAEYRVRSSAPGRPGKAGTPAPTSNTTTRPLRR